MESLTIEVVAVAFVVPIEAWERKDQEVEETLLGMIRQFLSLLEQYSPDTVTDIRTVLNLPLNECQLRLKTIVQKVEEVAQDNIKFREAMSNLVQVINDNPYPKVSILCLLMCHENLSRWFEAMYSSIEGKATLLNMSLDWQQERIPKSVMCDFLRLLGNYVNQNQISDPLKILKEIYKNLERKRRCQGPIVETSDQEKCSRVMDLKSFIEYNLEVPQELTGQELSDDDINALQTIDLAKSGVGKMENRRGFAWVTQTKSLQQIHQQTNSHSQDSSTVRNRLGLMHYQENQKLIEIKYPQEIIETCKLAMPTFIEGCPSRIYRSKSLNQDDQWGRTVNLETYEEDLPEAVHPSIPFGQGFSWQYLGRVEPMPSYQKELYFNNFPTGFTRDLFLELIINS